MSISPQEGGVARRTVVFFHGYDPRGAGLAYRILRKQIGAWQRTSGEDLSISSMKWTKEHYSSCVVSNPQDGVVTDYVFLQWEDIIREEMKQSVYQTMWRSLLYTWIGLVNGFFYRLFFARWPMGMAIVTPGLLYTLITLAPVLCSVAVWYGFGPWAAAGVFLLLCAGANYLIRSQYLRDVHWLALACLNYQSFLNKRGDAMRERIGVFKDIIMKLLDDPGDELLLVGHSCGTVLASLTAYEVLKECDPSRPLPAVSLLTLGDGAPLIFFNPNDQKLNDNIRSLAADPRINWTDVYAYSDILTVSEPSTRAYGAIFQAPDGVGGRRRRSARVKTRVSDERYRELLQSPLVMHYHYLEAPIRESSFNYIRLISWNKSLAEW